VAERLDFIVIGAQKAGTTSLWHYLRDHPDLYLPPDKEAPFFSHTINYERGFDWYLAEYFPLAPSGALTGTVTPHYMTGWEGSSVDVIAERIHATLPDVRLIALLRDPIERAISHFRMSQRRGMERRSFEQAIADQLTPQALEEARHHHTETNSYVTAGEYGRILDSYRRLFPRDQILVLYVNELRDEPQRLVKELLHFIGAEPERKGSAGEANLHFPSGSRRRVSVEAERALVRHLEDEIYPLVPEERRRFAARAFGFFFEGWNVVPDDRAPPIDVAMRDLLAEHFEADAGTLKTLGYEAPWLDALRSDRPGHESEDETPSEVVIERLETRVKQLEHEVHERNETIRRWNRGKH
jgi:hypothetical protein